MKKDIFLDSNIIIGILNNPTEIKNIQNIKTCFISVITIMELYALSGMSKTEEKKIDNLIKSFVVIEVTQSIAKQAGKLARTKTNRRHRADLIIAATALEFSLTIMTQNKKDFSGIKGLKVTTTK